MNINTAEFICYNCKNKRAVRQG